VCEGLSVASARPYPWPYDDAAIPAHTALLVVAAQPAVAERCPGAAAAVAVMAALASATRRWGARVVATRHAHSPAQGRPGFLPPRRDRTWEPVGLSESDAVVDAYGVDGFSGSPLAQRLAGMDVDHLMVCGLGLEGPVHSTLRSANDRGLECLLVLDGCAPLEPNLADASARIVEMSGGIFGAVADSDAVLTALAALEG
jgi:nicotinamidase-related amidase